MPTVLEEFDAALDRMESGDWRRGDRIDALMQIALRVLAAARESVGRDEAETMWAAVANVADQARRSKVADPDILRRLTEEERALHAALYPKAPSPPTDTAIARAKKKSAKRPAPKRPRR